MTHLSPKSPIFTRPTVRGTKRLLGNGLGSTPSDGALVGIYVDPAESSLFRELHTKLAENSLRGGPDAAQGFVTAKHGQIGGSDMISFVMGFETGFSGMGLACSS